MTGAFADTTYYLALLNADDSLHPLAMKLTPGIKGQVVTTAWILTEVLDALSRPPFRTAVAEFIMDLETDSRVVLVPPSRELFDAGLELFWRRPDKDWSLTDCISFVVMQERNLIEALTADHHFEQAGFRILMK